MTQECWHRFRLDKEVGLNAIPAKVAKVCEYCGQRLTFTFKDGLPAHARRWVKDEQDG